MKKCPLKSERTISPNGILEIQFSRVLKTEYPGIRYVPVFHEPQQAKRHDLSVKRKRAIHSSPARAGLLPAWPRLIQG